MIILAEMTQSARHLNINWMELLMFGMGGLLTLGLLVFFIVLFARNREKS